MINDFNFESDCNKENKCVFQFILKNRAESVREMAAQASNTNQTFGTAIPMVKLT